MKIDLHMLTMQLGIDLRTRGFSIEELRRSHELLVQLPAEAFISRFHRLRERLLQSEKQFRCVFLIRGPGSFHQLYSGVSFEGLYVPSKAAEKQK